jgi:hypothetical protein
VHDVRLDVNNYEEFRKKNKVFILSVSDSSCPTCCEDEPLLKFLQYSMVKDKLYLFKSKPI